jgi:hypothetical protein
MTPDQRAALRRESERQLTVGEVRSLLAIPISDEERENFQVLVRWFRTRYPEPAQRLAYARAAYARWQKTQGLLDARTRRR